MKRKLLYIILVMLLLAGSFGLKEYFRTNKDLSHEEPAAKLEASALVLAFEKDTLTARQRYVDKVISVSGIIAGIQDDDNPVIITLGNEGSLSSVQCSMDSTHKEDYSKLKAGTMATLKGICLGSISQELFGTDVKMNRCVVEKE